MSLQKIEELLDQKLSEELGPDTQVDSYILVAYLRDIADQIEMNQIKSTCKITHVKELPISLRVKSALIQSGIKEIADIEKDAKATAIRKVPGIGVKGFAELKEAVYNQCGIRIV